MTTIAFVVCLIFTLIMFFLIQWAGQKGAKYLEENFNYDRFKRLFK